MADFATTAANILSSLGIRGATVSDNKPGFVPVLDANGKISANLIPATAAQLAIPPLSNVAFVDPYTTVTEYSDDSTPVRLRNGSIVAPFKSIQEAAANFVPTSDAISDGRIAIFLAPGTYSDSGIAFDRSINPLEVYFIGLGECKFGVNVTTVAITGISGPRDNRTPRVVFQNIVTSGNISVDAAAEVVVIGKSRIHELLAASGASLLISSDSRVDSTGIDTVRYLSEAEWVGYSRRGPSDASFRDGTVARDLDRLDRRRVRLANVTFDSSGFAIDSASSYMDVFAGSSSGNDVFDLRFRDRQFVDGINELLRRGKNIVADTVDASYIHAGTLRADELRVDSITLGGYKLAIDTYGYLVVLDGSGIPPRPPTSVMMIMDSVTGALYMLGVADGRLYIVQTDDESSSSSSWIPATQIPIEDPDTGTIYILSVENGRLMISVQE